MMSDAELTSTRSKVSKLSEKSALSWLSGEVLLHSTLSVGVTAAVYVAYHTVTGETPKMGIYLHVITGITLGMLLIARVVVGLGKVSEAVSQVQAYSKACRSLALMATFVGETLTIQAGAEAEKKAVGKFRYELVRLLNLSAFSYHLHLNGNKMTVPPGALKGSMSEMETLSAASSPTLVVIKMVATLIDAQRKAARVSNEQVAAMMGKVDDLVSAYHGTLAQQLAPSPASLNSFAYFFVCLWVYTACPIIAINELGNDSPTNTFGGFSLAVAYAFGSALFFFGLFEAGKTVEAPAKAASQLLPLDDLKFALSADLSELIDDPEDEIPVFLVAKN